MRRTRHGRRTAVAILLTLVSVGAAGCGGDVEKKHSEVTITISSRGYPDEEILREIYGRALEMTGFEVRRRLGEPILPWEALEKGRISGYPDYLETALTEATPVKLEEIPESAGAAYRLARRRFEGKGLAPLPPARFGRTIAVAVPKKTAEEFDLKTLSDLKGPSREMRVADDEQFCHGALACLFGLEHNYGIVFRAFDGLYSPAVPPRVYRALSAGRADAAIVITTEGRLAREKGLVVLEDDQHRLPASNAFWLTRQDVIDEAGPDYEKAILRAQKGLTLKVMRELDAAVELEGKAPARVAAEYLKSIGYAGA
jgi:glycine betaine/choline ABC-type transport system substrate-binding protein